MSSTGFYLLGVHATGPKVLPATVRLYRGANVITGPSDTGKSYVLQIVRYLLGGADPPKSILQDTGYDSLWIGLEAEGLGRVVLRRSLRIGGVLKRHQIDFEKLIESVGYPEDSEGETLSTAQLSQFLLSLCGLVDRRIRFKANETEALTFRALRSFAVVDEARIIDERTPLRPSGQHPDAPREVATLKLLLTGIDDSGVVVRPDIKIEKASWRARAEQLDSLVRELSDRFKNEDELHADDASVIARFERDSQEVIERLAVGSAQLSALGRSRAHTWAQRRRLEARGAVVEQLLTQFTLLRDQYDSDVVRMAFVGEGEAILAQFGHAACPLCGQDISQESHVQFNEVEAVREGISVELHKLNQRRADLETTIVSLEGEQYNLRLEIAEQSLQIDRLDWELAEVLRPQILREKAALAELEDGRRRLAVRSAEVRQLNLLETERKRLGAEPKRRKRAPPVEMVAAAETKGRRDLCDEMERVLERWRFPGVGTVEFDAKDNIVIAGRPASSHGKGYRAVIHAAFSVALARVSRVHGHPGWVIMDSPLTSYRPTDAYEVDADVQRAFWEFMAKMDSDLQVVILENKEPPGDVAVNLRLTRFSGVPGVGRSGFYPEV